MVSSPRHPYDRSALGAFIRLQRQRAQISQRELARLCGLSNPYVSQIERGRHDPSIRVLRSIAEVLDIRAETMLAYAGWLPRRPDSARAQVGVERAILADHRLTSEQQQALLSTYHAFLTANRAVD